MFMNPSSYRSIHIQSSAKTTRYSGVRFMLDWFKRHAAKIIVSAALFALLFTSFLMMGTSATGSGPISASDNEIVITVSTGDTLWDIAKRHNTEGKDIRAVIYKIQKRNNLQSDIITAGQRLVLP